MNCQKTKPDGTIIFRRNGNILIFQIFFVFATGGLMRWSAGVLISMARHGEAVTTMFMEMLLPINWGGVLFFFLLVTLFRPIKLELSPELVSWRTPFGRPTSIPAEQLGWISVGDIETIAYQGPYLAPRKTKQRAIQLFSKDAALLVSFSPNSFACKPEQIAASLAAKTQAELGAPAHPSHTTLKPGVITKVLYGSILANAGFMMLAVWLSQRLER